MRILEDEAGLDERILPIERHAVQEDHALRIHEDLYVLELENMIVGRGFASNLN